MVKPSTFVSKAVELGIFAVYATAWRVARPLLRRHKRLRDEFAMRLVPENWSVAADIWLQAASGGEAYLAWEWLKALPCFASNQSDTSAPDASYLHREAHYGDQAKLARILLTSCTRQGLDVLLEAAAWAEDECTKRGLPRLDITVQVFPLDQPSIMARALRMVSPRVVVLFETELWPSLMRACRDASVPTMVLNGRMSPRSFAAYSFLRFFWQGLAPQRMAAISHDDAMRFAMLFGTDVDVVPNIKFDRVSGSLGMTGGREKLLETFSPCPQTPIPFQNVLFVDEADSAARDSRPQKRKMILLGSVREEEEVLLMSTVCQLLQMAHKEKTQAIVIAPRHMHRVSAWQERLFRVGLTYSLRSKCEEVREAFCAQEDSQASIIIWDTFGELDALYGLADAVFVGGSLVPLGGQNFLEPLAKGHIPCVGPYLHHFAWVEPQSLEDDGLLHIVRTDTELAQALFDAAHDDNLDEGAVRTRFHDWLEPRLGGASASVHMVMAMLNEGAMSD